MAVGDVVPPVRLQARETNIVNIMIKAMGRMLGFFIPFLLVPYENVFNLVNSQ